jgi:hypothetical protein
LLVDALGFSDVPAAITDSVAPTRLVFPSDRRQSNADRAERGCQPDNATEEDDDFEILPGHKQQAEDSPGREQHVGC